MSNRSHSTTSRRVALAALLSLAAACAAPDRVTAPAGASPARGTPAHSVLAPLLGATGGVVGRIVECTLPTGVATADSAVIGPEGGSLVVGRTRVDIPAGAVPAPETFVLSVPQGKRVKIEVHAVGYAHYRFDAPVQITVDYARCGDFAGDDAPLRAWYVDGDDAQALEDMGGVVNVAEQTLTFRTPHFSIYMLAE